MITGANYRFILRMTIFYTQHDTDDHSCDESMRKRPHVFGCQYVSNKTFSSVDDVIQNHFEDDGYIDSSIINAGVEGENPQAPIRIININISSMIISDYLKRDECNAIATWRYIMPITVLADTVASFISIRQANSGCEHPKLKEFRLFPKLTQLFPGTTRADVFDRKISIYLNKTGEFEDYSGYLCSHNSNTSRVI